MYVITTRLLATECGVSPVAQDLLRESLRQATRTGGSGLEHAWLRSDQEGVSLVLFLVSGCLADAEDTAFVTISRILDTQGEFAGWTLAHQSADLIVLALDAMMFRPPPRTDFR
ncbi:hypothetical protein [Nonomuraea dietziae]|uniref:hypothetical protein n=1 Tax=Nonomuraea dietziae TaxID=65515 RepID=UPI00340E0DCA